MNAIYLLITPYFPSENDFRGSYILDQAKAIRKLSNYDIKIIKLCNEDGNYEYEGFEIIQLKTLHLPSNILPGFFHFYNYMKLKKLLKKFVNINEIKMIHAHSIYPAGNLAYSLKKEFDIKTLIQYHGLSVFQTNLGRLLKGKLKTIHNSYIENKYLKIANDIDLNIGVSNKVINQLKKYPKFSNKTYILYNGIDTTKFFKIDLININKVYTIGCIANFWEIKDQITLLKAINQLKNLSIKVIFIGSGPDLNFCKKYVKENELNKIVEFRKEVSHEKLNEFYNNIELFVLPSFYEALGCVYMEALQVGKPIIAVKNQGIEELLNTKDKEYFLINKSNVNELIELILFHYNNKNHEFVNYNFDINIYIQKFLHDLEGNNIE